MNPLRTCSRCTLPTTLAAACALATHPASAQQTPVKFLLDLRFEGPDGMFLVPLAKNHFKDEKLNVTGDAANDSGGTVTRVASGAYDMGFAGLAALMEFHANYPTVANKPVAAMMVYNNTPAAVLALKKSGIETPADLNGKKLGAPVFDAGRKAWPVFAKANDISGVRADEVVVLPYPSYGVKPYGNAIIVGEEFLKKNPEIMKAFLRGFTKGMRDVIADPKASIVTLKARDGIIDVALEERRLRLALDATVLTPDARAEGFGMAMGPRLSLMARQVSDAFATKERVKAEEVWNGAFLPSAAERIVFAAAKK